MKVAVWDTYVNRKDGKVMHFDILVPSDLDDKNVVFDFGIQYLKRKPFNTNKLSTKECKFCHIEQATEEIKNSINTKGYYIIEMQNCN
jgi:hypothetical protein